MARLKDCFVKRNAPYLPTKRLIEELYRVGDGRLRIRWSTRRGQWCLEERAAPSFFGGYLPPIGVRVLVGPKGHQREEYVENDSYVRLIDGYQLVGYYTVETLHYPDWLIRDIESNDKRRHGGTLLKVLAKIEEREEKQKAITEKDAAWARREISEDIYYDWNWRQGERVAVPTNYQR